MTDIGDAACPCASVTPTIITMMTLSMTVPTCSCRCMVSRPVDECRNEHTTRVVRNFSVCHRQARGNAQKVSQGEGAQTCTDTRTPPTPIVPCCLLDVVCFVCVCVVCSLSRVCHCVLRVCAARRVASECLPSPQLRPTQSHQRPPTTTPYAPITPYMCPPPCCTVE